MRAERWMAVGITLVGLAVAAGCQYEPNCTGPPVCPRGMTEVEECPERAECREVSTCSAKIICASDDGADDGTDAGSPDTTVDAGADGDDATASPGGPVHYGGGHPERQGDGWERPESMNWPEIGGGVGYGMRICEPPADAVRVTRVDELVSALASAGDGEVVWVPGGTELDLTMESQIEVPEGVTLASDRGCGGSEGAVLRRGSSEADTAMVVVRAGARVTGFELRGYGYSQRGPDFTPAPRQATSALGVVIAGDTAELDNNRITSFVGKCVRVQAEVSDAWIHHNRIEWCNRLAEGFGVLTRTGSETLIEFNRIDNTRHAIFGAGGSGCLYEARYNVVGPYRQNNVFDMHASDGVSGHMLVHHNTFLGKWTYKIGDDCVQGQPYLSVRATPVAPTQIHRNWMVDQDRQWIYAIEGDNYEASGNHLGTSEPGCDVGAPRRGCSRYAAPMSAPPEPEYDGYRAFGSYNVDAASSGKPCLEPPVE